MANRNDKRLQREYVASGSRLGVMAMRQALASLPPFQGEPAKRFGDSVYEAMARDGAVRANLRVLVSLALRNGIRWETPVEGPKPGRELVGEDKSRYEKASAIKDEFEANLRALPRSLDDVARELLFGALAYGSKVAEVNRELKGGRLLVSSIKAKPRKSYGLVVDLYLNLVGIVPNDLAIEDGVATVPTLQVLGEGNEKVLPREKFLVLTFDQADEDPRGVPAIDSAYEWWYVKKNAPPELLKNVVQNGARSLVGILPEASDSGLVYDSDGEEETDGSGEPIEQTDEAGEMLSALQSLEGGYAAVLPFGSMLVPLEPGNADAIAQGIDLCNREIAFAILSQVRATVEAKNGSRADSDTGKDILDVVVEALQQLVGGTLERDLARVWVAHNYGDQAAEEFTPRAVLGEVAQEDFAGNAPAVGSLHAAGYLADEHYAELDAKLGLTPRDMNAWKRKQEEERSLLEESVRDRKRTEEPDVDDEAE
jgi:hypothetical protein